MTFGEQIAKMRKNKNMTQEALAQQLGVTNQAVSKWESDQCFPDVTLLPKLADIFVTSIDALFGRPVVKEQSPHLPWPDDDTLRAVIFVGRSLVDGHPAAKEISFHYEGPALNIDSAFSVCCADVEGNVTAGSAVNCGDVDGSVQAGGNVNCGDVDGAIRAGGNVSCGDVDGDLCAGGKITCGNIRGNLTVKSADCLR